LRNFIDLCLSPEKPSEVISIAKTLGYSAIGLSQNEYVEGIDVVKRLDLDPRNTNELNRSLRNSRWHNEIITVNCRNKSVARQAGRDNRVDLITYPLVEKWKENHLNHQQAGLMRDSGCGYLVDLSLLLTNDAYILSKRTEFLKRNVHNALKRDIPVVASSYAVDKWGQRDPYGLASLLSLLGVEEEKALDMVSSVPYDIVKRNRGKLKDSYIIPGVWVIDDE
jgi:RNase P/RNase MRP subunit p30